MSDNLTIRDYNGDPVIVRADDISSIFWQYLKVAFGTDGTATVVDAANPLPSAMIGIASEEGWPENDVDSGDPVQLTTDDFGRLWTLRAESPFSLATTKVTLSSSQTGTAAVTPGSGYRWNLLRMVIVCSTAGTVHFFRGNTDNAQAAIGPDLDMVENQIVELRWDSEWPRYASTDQALKYTTDTFVGSVYLEWYEQL